MARYSFAESLLPFELNYRDAEEGIPILERQKRDLKERDRRIGDKPSPAGLRCYFAEV